MANAERNKPCRVVLVLALSAGGLACASEGGDRSASLGSPYTYGDFEVRDSAPALPRGTAGAWDDGLVDPGAVVFQGGRLHALYNAIRGWPNPLSVGYATSFDGADWQRQASGPVLTVEDLPFEAWTLRANSVVIEDGEWILYFSVARREGWLIGSVGRATAISPGGPWSVDPSLVLTPGPGWDEGGVGDAKVVPGSNGYVMFYTGRNANGGVAIGRAESLDGIRWTKDRDPVLRPGRPGAWDDSEVSDPSVARSPDGGWVMIYRGGDGAVSALGWAQSPDGVDWERMGGPVITPESSSAWDVVYYTSLVAIQTRQLVFFEAGLRETGRTDVFLASRRVNAFADW